MAMIGATIGLMFAVSLVGAPLLYSYGGMDSVFALTGVLSLGAMAVVRYFVPDPSAPPARPPQPGRTVVRRLDPEMLRLNLGIFVLHIVLYAMFVVVPPMLVRAGWPLAEHWQIYLPVLAASFVLMVPAILYADRRNRPRPVLLGAVLLLAAVEALLAATDLRLGEIVVLMLGFFVAFNVLEAMLPALVSRAAPAHGRGLAIGVYNTTQTLGVFFGGLVGGGVAEHIGPSAVVGTGAGLCGLWLAVALGMQGPRPAVNDLSSLTFTIASGVNLDGLGEALARLPGVREAEVLGEQRIARLKVVPGEWDESGVRKLVSGEA
jgi:predicted MFS family arabinose efflux permease